MSTWTVTISDPLNGSVLATVENGRRSDTGEVAIRSFDPPSVTPPGSGKSLNLYVKQRALSIPPRAIIQFALDDTPVFWGPAVITPPANSPGAGPRDTDRDALERVTVVGGELLLQESVAGPRLFDAEALDELGSSDPATIAYELCRLYAHPALTVDEENFPATGGALSIFYRPLDTLEVCLRVLKETITGGATFWVDASGAVHFQANEGA